MEDILLSEKFQTLVGKYIYTQQPKLVYSGDEPIHALVLVKKVIVLENVAACVINDKIQVGYSWMSKLIEESEK